MRIKGVILSVAIVVVSSGIKAQNAGSPYTSLGIGALADRGTVYNANMGGLGLSNGNVLTLNIINPALLPLNTFTTFDAALFAESRVISTDSLSQKNFSANLRYLAFGFPLLPGKLTISFGLSPYSFVNYDIESSAQVINKERDVDYLYTGEGGYNQVFLAAGIKLSKSLYLGIRASYLFSQISDASLVNIPPDSTNFSSDFVITNYVQDTRFSDFVFQPAIAYKLKLGDKTNMNLGATYEYGGKINTFRNEILQTESENGIVFLADTLVYNQKYKSTLPSRTGIGVSLSQEYTWTVGMDFYVQDWSNFKDYKSDNQGLSKSFDFILGGSFTPDFASVNNYLKRVAYQLGFYYKKTPLVVNNTQIDDFGMNFGVSLPVGRSASTLNLGFTLGHMGTSSNGLIKEDYARVRIGMTFNDRSFGWYRNQRKYN